MARARKPEKIFELNDVLQCGEQDHPFETGGKHYPKFGGTFAPTLLY
jgi:hypothetical protein